MKKENVKLFKQFLSFRGLEKMFYGLYRTHKFESNPESIDKYLEEVDAHFVIMDAFDFNRIKATGPFDSRFWSNLTKAWIKYMKKQSANGYYRNEIVIPRVPVKDADGNVKPTEEAQNEKPDVVDYNWSGLDLVPLNQVGRRMMPAPLPLEIRVATYSGNVMVLSEHLSYQIIRDGLDTVSIQVDRRTNSMVLLFSKNGDFKVRQYSTSLYSVQHKVVIETLQKYLRIKFDAKKVYYIKVKEKMWNPDHTKCAVIVTTDYTEKDRS